MIKLKDLILEQDELYLSSLKQKLDQLNNQADSRYREVANQSSTTVHSNPFEPYHTSYLSPEEGHRAALADSQYRELKRRIVRIEVIIRRVEKQLRKKKM